MKKKALILLCVGLCLILCGSILASVFNGGAGAVKVSRICFTTPNGSRASADTCSRSRSTQAARFAG